MDFVKFEEKYKNAISATKLKAWDALLKSAHLATKDIRFGDLIHRWTNKEGLIGLYTKIGDYKGKEDTARRITIHVRLGGLNIGHRVVNPTGDVSDFVPRVVDKSTKDAISDSWSKSRNMGEFLTTLKEKRKTLFRKISKEHWVESQLLVLANNPLAIRAGIKKERDAFKNIAPLGLGQAKSRIPYQLPVPLKFDHQSRSFPMSTGKWGYVDAILYSRFLEVLVCEVKDPASGKIDADEFQAVIQAYSYARCIQQYGGSNFLKLSGMKKIRKYSAVAIVGDQPELLAKLKADASEIQKYELARSRNPITPKILTYSASEFIVNRKVSNLRWLAL